MSMTTALSGLIAAQQDISTTSHNIANVGTNAFRKSRAEFVDDYYTSPMDSVRTVVGSGTHMNRVAVQFEQGNFVATGQTLDMGIQGPGFFTVAPQLDINNQPTEVLYTRNGGFKLNENGMIGDGAGRVMLAWPVAQDGSVLQMTPEALGPVHVPLMQGASSATENLSLHLRMPSSNDMLGSQDAVPPTNAFDPDDATSFAFSTAVPVVDADGNAIEARAYFVKSAEPNATSTETEFQMHLMVDGLVFPSTDPSGFSTFSFDAGGVLTATSGAMEFANSVGTYSVDVTGTRMEDNPFVVLSADHDGGSPEGLSNLEVDQMGVIWANYGTDDRIALARVALTNFPNPQGLSQDGNASFKMAAESGEPTYSAPGEKGLGQVQSGMLERSNVDLTEELVHLITAQRNYQANAKAMETSSSLMQTIMNIRN